MRIGTLEPPLARKVASLAATLHQKVSQTMPARDKAAAAARITDLTKLARNP